MEQGLYELLERVKQGPWHLYGSGIIAYNIYSALQRLANTKPEYIIVSEKRKEDHFFDEKKVIDISSVAGQIPSREFVVIATPEIYHRDIVEKLEVLGFDDYIMIDAELEYAVMSGFFEKDYHIQMISNNNSQAMHKRKVDVGVYMARSSKDKPVVRQYNIPDYMMSIQVGAELSADTPDVLRDNTGEHISDKNENYCELTAAYWVWKNTGHDYKGICHYRRFLDIPVEDIEQLKLYDAVLPLPFICKRDISDQYKRYVDEKYLNRLLQVLKDTSTKDYSDMQKVLKGKLIYNYNIFIARQRVFDDYCEWMFPILSKVEEHFPYEREHPNRYIGYLGELMTTLYFISHADRLKLGHAKKIWMI